MVKLKYLNTAFCQCQS